MDDPLLDRYQVSSAPMIIETPPGSTTIAPTPKGAMSCPRRTSVCVIFVSWCVLAHAKFSPYRWHLRYASIVVLATKDSYHPQRESYPLLREEEWPSDWCYSAPITPARDLPTLLRADQDTEEPVFFCGIDNSNALLYEGAQLLK